MMRIIYISCLLLGSCVVMAQQDAMYTQFAYNKVSYNPAFAAQLKYADFSIMIRDQWNGLDGSPASQILTAAIPWNKKSAGLGVIASRETIGITQVTNLRTMYSYGIQMDNGVLSGGLELSGRRYAIDFTDDRLVAFEGIESDPSLVDGIRTNFVVNTGVGFYYKTKAMYASVSAPRLLNIKYQGLGLSEEVRHLYIMAGSIIEVNEDFDLLPQVLLKFAEHSPFDMDVQASIIYKKEYHAGINFRVGGAQTSLAESLAFLFGFRPVENLFFGFSYDVTLSPLRRYESGSLEAIFKYSLGENDPKETIINPRYF